jgi:hypothetical protein
MKWHYQQHLTTKHNSFVKKKKKTQLTIMNSTTIQQHNITIHQFEQNSQSTHFHIT